MGANVKSTPLPLALRAHSCASGGCNDGRQRVGFAGAMAVAMAVDALVGWPAWLFARIGHPVTWLGALINVLGARCNRNGGAPGRRRAAGIAAALLFFVIAVGVGLALQLEFSHGWSRVVLVGIMSWPFVALRSLHVHVAAVARPPQAGR